jgi:hypothetical protein
MRARGFLVVLKQTRRSSVEQSHFPAGSERAANLRSWFIATTSAHICWGHTGVPSVFTLPL